MTKPNVVNHLNQTFIMRGNMRYWIDDLDLITVDCIRRACENVGESSDQLMFESEIDHIIDDTRGASAFYLDSRKWEKC